MKIWMYWHDNDDFKTAPYLNQKCIQKWKELNQQSYEFRLLNKESAYTQEPQFKDIVENCKYERSHAAQSDLLRLILLEKHGGIWVDSSVYPMKPLREFLDTMTGHSDFFSYRFFPRSLSKRMGDRELVSWFLVAKSPGLYIMKKWLELYTLEYINSANWKYFTIHQTLCNLYDSDKEIRDTINTMNQVTEYLPHSVIRLGVENRIPHAMYKRPISKQRGGDGRYEIKYLEDS